MKEDRPSLTALAVAAGRAVGTADDLFDEPAASLVPTPLGRLLRAAHTRGPLRNLSRLASFGMVDHVTLRMAAIDQAVAEAVADRCSQLVVLGAGLDARALRLPCLGTVDVFEVDHPATQATKRRRIDPTRSRAKSLHFVPVDFEVDSLDLRLDEAGHDPLRATVWIWEGVTPYLGAEAVEATLRTIGARSAPGSRLAMTYAVESHLPTPILTRLAFSALSEPIVFTMTPDEAARRAAASGFAPTSDTNSTDWSQTHPGNARLATLFAAERLLVATKHARG